MSFIKPLLKGKKIKTNKNKKVRISQIFYQKVFAKGKIKKNKEKLTCILKFFVVRLYGDRFFL